MKTLVFADVHLKGYGEDAATLNEFVAFLRGIDPEEFSRVVMLGDLFDFWFEYRHVIFAEYFEVLRALADLRDAGVELHLVCGNHDFWAGRFLREELGIHVHPDRFLLDAHDKRVLFVHGDGVNPRDWSYRLYKRFARWPIVVGLFRMLHPDFAMTVARRVSRASRRRFDEHFDNEPEIRAVREHGRRCIERGEADIVISGHTHAVDDVTWDMEGRTGRYLNTGDWMIRRCYLVWDGAEFTPMRYEAPAGHPNPRQASVGRQTSR